MKHLVRRPLLSSLCALVALSPLTSVTAQTYPTKAIKLLVGSPPGAPSDITARLFGEQLQKRLGQPVVIDNRPGAGNNLAANTTATSEPDGYTLVLSPDTVLTINPHIYSTKKFDARKDLASVSILASFSQMLVCNPAVGVKTVAELISKSKTQRITYGSGGSGVPGHLAAEMFLQVTGAKMDHVPYRGPAPATLAVLSKEVDCGFLATPTLIQHVSSGKLTALAVSSSVPSPLAPEVPTLGSAIGQPGLDISFRLVLQAPKSTPPQVLATLEKSAEEIMKNPELRTKLQASDVVAIGSDSSTARRTMAAEIVRWEPLVKRLDLKAN